MVSLVIKVVLDKWGSKAQLHMLASKPESQHSLTTKFQRKKLLKLLRLINGAAERKVDSGLKNVDQTYLVLASDKLVSQESF